MTVQSRVGLSNEDQAALTRGGFDLRPIDYEEYLPAKLKKLYEDLARTTEEISSVKLEILEKIALLLAKCKLEPTPGNDLCDALSDEPTLPELEKLRDELGRRFFLETNRADLEHAKKILPQELLDVINGLLGKIDYSAKGLNNMRILASILADVKERKAKLNDLKAFFTYLGIAVDADANLEEKLRLYLDGEFWAGM